MTERTVQGQKLELPVKSRGNQEQSWGRISPLAQASAIAQPACDIDLDADTDHGMHNSCPGPVLSNVGIALNGAGMLMQSGKCRQQKNVI